MCIRDRHNISQRFKKEDRFTGKIGEDINEYFENYELAAEDYSVSSTQKHRYLHNLFEEEAKRFYRSEVQTDSLSYEDARLKMEKEFNSFTRQNRVRQYLQGLHFDKFIEK